jgi:hypothetical protein
MIVPSLGDFLRKKGASCLSPAKAGRVLDPPQKIAVARAAEGPIMRAPFLWFVSLERAKK